jgi:hypothetical protein
MTSTGALGAMLGGLWAISRLLVIGTTLADNAGSRATCVSQDTSIRLWDYRRMNQRSSSLNGCEPCGEPLEMLTNDEG